jgi:hypothetical protein
MGLFSGKSETSKLDDTLDDLPDKVADWTPAQRDTFTAQSDRAMREQNGVNPDSN